MSFIDSYVFSPSLNIILICQVRIVIAIVILNPCIHYMYTDDYHLYVYLHCHT